MTIYTGRGDEGLTDLHGGDRVAKTSPRIEAYGTVDEVNALIGTVRPTGHDDVDGHLEAVQNHLHVVQAQLANPDSGDDDPRIRSEHVERLEAWIDECDEELSPLRSFVLPGGSAAGAKLHHVRAVCRRAERRTVALVEAAEGEVDEEPMVYLNRLSDALFTFARLVNQRDGEREEAPTY
jgi:cob(I)alamin adenosyltransferase